MTSFFALSHSLNCLYSAEASSQSVHLPAALFASGVQAKLHLSVSITSWMVTVVPGVFCALHRLLHCRIPATFLPCGGLVHAVQVLENHLVPGSYQPRSVSCEVVTAFFSFFWRFETVASWIPWRMTKQLPARFLLVILFLNQSIST